MISYPWNPSVVSRTVEVSRDESFLAIDVAFVADKVIRAMTDGDEDDLIESYIRAAMELYEHDTNYSLIPKRLQLLLSGFPVPLWSIPGSGYITLPSPPVRDIISISYYDTSDESQDYGGSPPSWIFVGGGRTGIATIQPGGSDVWPSTATRPDAVTVTYDVGYETASEVPALVKTGLGMVVAELYKNPDLSNDMGQVGNLLNLDRFWRKHY